MKTKLLTFIILFASATILTSCKKCVTCTYTVSGGATAEQEVCKGDDMTNDEWEAYVRDLEDADTVCN